MIKKLLHLFKIHDWSEWEYQTDGDLRWEWRTCWLCDKTEENYFND